MEIAAGSRPRIAGFVQWVAVGAAFCLAVLTPFTIGLAVLAAGVVSLVLLLTRAANRNGSISGLISGVGLVPLYVGYLNRKGPGEVCSTSTTGDSHCVSEWSPWPWFLAGVVFVLGGIALFVWLRRAAGGRD
jgi:membrane protein implicated in regulation of membrane protease activity